MRNTAPVCNVTYLDVFPQPSYFSMCEESALLCITEYRPKLLLLGVDFGDDEFQCIVLRVPSSLVRNREYCTQLLLHDVASNSTTGLVIPEHFALGNDGFVGLVAVQKLFNIMHGDATKRMASASPVRWKRQFTPHLPRKQNVSQIDSLHLVIFTGILPIVVNPVIPLFFLLPEFRRSSLLKYPKKVKCGC